MKYRRLGASGLHVSEIAFGNWLTHASQIEEDAAIACVHAALDVGITTFDTADIYAVTKAEEVLARALSGQRREGLEVFTKVFWPIGPSRNDRGLSRKHIREACEGSLRRLGVDYLDLYQAHRFDHNTPLEETLRAFDDLVCAGKVLYVGVSEWRAEQIAAAVEIGQAMGYHPLVSNQPQYSMLWRVPEAEVIPTCQAHGIGQIVWSPVAQGVLTGKYRPGQPVPKDSRATDSGGGANFIARWLRDEVLERVEQLGPIADDLQLTRAQLAVAWVLANPAVSAAIIGASRPEQVLENAQASDAELGADVMAAIDSILGDAVIRDPALTTSPRSLR
ncbi:MAG: aldo/keto reductase family protein [Actinomycetes bacterium]